MMAISAEPSSSLSFTSSSNLSNGSINHNLCSSSGSEALVPSLEVMGLNKLSSSLEQLLVDSSCDYSDAEIVVEGTTVGVHRCILAARSGFFHDLFKKDKGGVSEKGSKPKYSMKDLLPYGNVGYEAFMVFLSYVYTGKHKPSPTEVSTCVDDICPHDSCRPAINFVVELMYASSIFKMPELVSLFQRRLLNFVGKALVEDVIPILVVAFHCQLSQLHAQCIDRVVRSDLELVSLEKELPHEVAEEIKLLRSKHQCIVEDNTESVDPLREKRIRRIHKALDSDDVELVKLLLTESDITLDDANALHYAAAYCDPKVVNEVLGLGLADVNLRNSRGYTVLHIAAMRKEPSIIVSLLTKGACASELTSDGQSAVSICRRLTRPKDYHVKMEQGQETNKDRICIDVLEREMRRNPMAPDASMSSQTMADDFHMRLLYLENRVAFARLFFPSEAKLAMDIAHAETTSEFARLSMSKSSNGNLREVDLNETPIVQRKRLFSRMEALMKTVEMGRRYFPHCSEVLDKFMEDDLPEMLYLETGTPEEQKIKRMRFVELKEDVQNAFDKDKAEFNRVVLSSSSSSSSLKLRESVKQKTRKLLQGL
ncbi:Potassium channel [Trema orientale]|uniref:Potassium channel n=1 Tax=Trema orientale TaxID=63057 RepID=A0A2P5CLX3_TREOI|nr:Potassium channel [Trema orientale]